MKVIFLDIDGVLVTRRAWSNQPEDWVRLDKGEFHKPVIEMFEEWLTAHPDVKIVLSSTWRKLSEDYGILHWKQRIGKESPLLLSRIIDTTPIGDSLRGFEISEWMRAHPEVTKFCIIDDESDMLAVQKHFLVQTKDSIGLTRAHLKRVEELLDVH